jgi:hypothetical protein
MSIIQITFIFQINVSFLPRLPARQGEVSHKRTAGRHQLRDKLQQESDVA